MALGVSKMYNSANPFDFMEMISLQVRGRELCFSATEQWGERELGRNWEGGKRWEHPSAHNCSLSSLLCSSHYPPTSPHHPQGKTNFFEKRVGDYQKSGVMAGMNSKLHDFNLDEDF